jgi:competence protein ComEA
MVSGSYRSYRIEPIRRFFTRAGPIAQRKLNKTSVGLNNGFVMILSRLLAAAAVSTLLVGQALAQAQPAPTTPATPGATTPGAAAPSTTTPSTTQRPAANQAQHPATTAPAAPSTAQPARPAAPTTAQPAHPAAPAAPTTAQPARPAAPAAQAPAASGGTAARPAQGQTHGAPVNLNTATQAELDALPQIGPARAQAIIAERAKGRFQSWEDFDRRMTGSAVNHQAKEAIRARVRF